MCAKICKHSMNKQAEASLTAPTLSLALLAYFGRSGTFYVAQPYLYWY